MEIKKKLVDYITLGLFITCIIIYILKIHNIVGIINSYILIMFGFLGVSLLDMDKNKFIKNKRILISLSIKVVISVFFTISYFRIFVTQDYQLRNTYWVFLISIFIIINTFIFEKLRSLYYRRVMSGKKLNKLCIGIIVVIYIMVFLYNLMNLMPDIIQKEKRYTLHDLRTPEYITIYREGDNLNNFPLYTIDNKDDINKFIKDLQEKAITNITLTDLFNYERMQENNRPNFRLFFSYKDTYDEESGLENGFITELNLTANGKVVLMNKVGLEKLFSIRDYYFETYPVSLSKETLEMFDSYIKRFYRND